MLPSQSGRRWGLQRFGNGMQCFWAIMGLILLSTCRYWRLQPSLITLQASQLLAFSASMYLGIMFIIIRWPGYEPNWRPSWWSAFPFALIVSLMDLAGSIWVDSNWWVKMKLTLCRLLSEQMEIDLTSEESSTSTATTTTTTVTAPLDTKATVGVPPPLLKQPPTKPITMPLRQPPPLQQQLRYSNVSILKGLTMFKITF